MNKIKRCRELDDIEHSDATFGKIIDAASEKGRLATQLADDLEVALEALDNIIKHQTTVGGSMAKQSTIVLIAQAGLDKIRGKV